MSKVLSIKIQDIVLDKSIYPRSNIDHKRVSMFEENMRDGIKFDLIHLQAHPDDQGNIASWMVPIDLQLIRALEKKKFPHT